MNINNEQNVSGRGSSPIRNPSAQKLDTWGEGRLRSIKETPEDAFADVTETQHIGPTILQNILTAYVIPFVTLPTQKG